MTDKTWMQLKAELHAKNEEIEKLREKIAQLETLLIGDTPLPPELKLSRLETKAFGILLQNKVASDEKLHILLYGADADSIAIEQVRIIIHRLRKRLETFGISIITQRGIGYSVSEKDKAIIRKMQKTHEAIDVEDEDVSVT